MSVIPVYYEQATTGERCHTIDITHTYRRLKYFIHFDSLLIYESIFNLHFTNYRSTEFEYNCDGILYCLERQMYREQRVCGWSVGLTMLLKFIKTNLY